ncbi:MAG TPA: HAD-IB family hydrolase [Caulobacteraceae bacterium]|jgi:phosphatidylglycerophosphatase C|nr:HAD-IB family hydrolase [Caulobacteraceae bacterium]
MGTSSHNSKGVGAGAQAPPEPLSTGEQRPIVAFDFDGTLTVKDTFNAFLAWRVSGPRFVSGLLKLAPAGSRYLFNRDRNALKASAVSEFLTGVTRIDLEAEARAFRDEVWDRFMRPDALESWAEWGDRGAERVIVTASPETTVSPFAERLGADRLIGTRLRFDSEDRVEGGLETRNCRGPEKVRRLQAVFGPEVRLVAAYGDTAGDTEMLALAAAPGYRVFTGKP